MGRTACTEPQCLYSTAIPLLPLWAVWPVQSLSAYTRVHFTFTLHAIRQIGSVGIAALTPPHNHAERGSQRQTPAA